MVEETVEATRVVQHLNPSKSPPVVQVAPPGDLGEMQKEAVTLVQRWNPGCRNAVSGDSYNNFLGGMLIDVEFMTIMEQPAINHVHFVNGRVRIYTKFGDVCEAVINFQPNWFFRFLDFAGVGGAIASFLMIIFGVLLCILAVGVRDANSSILDIVKLCFVIILGYFFGSQTRRGDM